jgi:hypothetical protein
MGGTAPLASGRPLPSGGSSIPQPGIPLVGRPANTSGYFDPNDTGGLGVGAYWGKYPTQTAGVSNPTGSPIGSNPGQNLTKPLQVPGTVGSTQYNTKSNVATDPNLGYQSGPLSTGPTNGTPTGGDLTNPAGRSPSAGTQAPPSSNSPQFGIYQDWLNTWRSKPTSDEGGQPIQNNAPSPFTEQAWNSMSPTDRWKQITNNQGSVQVTRDDPRWNILRQQLGGPENVQYTIYPGDVSTVLRSPAQLTDPTAVYKGDGFTAFRTVDNNGKDIRGPAMRNSMDNQAGHLFDADSRRFLGYFAALAGGGMAYNAAAGAGAAGAGTGAASSGAGVASPYLNPISLDGMLTTANMTPAASVLGGGAAAGAAGAGAGSGVATGAGAVGAGTTISNALSNPAVRWGAGTLAGPLINSALGNGGGPSGGSPSGGSPSGSGNGTDIGSLIQGGAGLGSNNREIQQYQDLMNQYMNRGDYNSQYRPGYLSNLNDSYNNPDKFLAPYKAGDERDLENMRRGLDAKGYNISGNELGELTKYQGELRQKHLMDIRNDMRQSASLGHPEQMATAGLHSLPLLFQMRANRNAAASGVGGQIAQRLLGSLGTGVQRIADWFKGSGSHSFQDAPDDVKQILQQGADKYGESVDKYVDDISKQAGNTDWFNQYVPSGGWGSTPPSSGTTPGGGDFDWNWLFGGA